MSTSLNPTMSIILPAIHRPKREVRFRLTHNFVCIFGTTMVSMILLKHKRAVVNDPPVDAGPGNGTPVPKPNEERPDFDRSANELWTLFGTEAKSHDDARVNTLKDDMDGVLIFVCSYLSVPIYELG